MNTEEIDIERILAVFREADSNKNGIVSKEEFRAILDQKGFRFSDEQVNLLIDMFDKNSDGQLNEDEFVEGMQRLSL